VRSGCNRQKCPHPFCVLHMLQAHGMQKIIILLPFLHLVGWCLLCLAIVTFNTASGNGCYVTGLKFFPFPLLVPLAYRSGVQVGILPFGCDLHFLEKLQ
jgi:hypothetical protein